MTLSLQYVNYMDCIVRYGIGVLGGWGGVVIQVAYGAKYVGLKLGIAMASLGAIGAQ